LTRNRNKFDWIEIDRKGERKYSPARKTGIRGSALLGHDDTVLGYRAEVGWRTGERKGKKVMGWLGFGPRIDFNKKFFFFFKYVL
jgi:hypothetical protein